MKSAAKPYFINLDGLRAIAALSVVFFHICSWIPYPETKGFDILRNLLSFNHKGGSLGVTFFFILSGFLITYLLIHEKEKRLSIDIGYFYLRRILRIWPLYFMTLFVGFFLYPAVLSYLNLPSGNHASGWLYSVFLANFDHIYNSLPGNGILGVHWSVAVEEQFYLVWPILFYLNKQQKWLPLLLFITFIASEVFYLFQTNFETQYYHFGSCVRYLAWGGLVAFFCYFHADKISKILARAGKAGTLLIYVVSLFFLFSGDAYLYKFPALARLGLVSQTLPFLFFSYVIVEQNFSSVSFFKIGRLSWLTSLGTISYGIYLIHMIVICFLLLTPLKSPGFFIVNVVLVPLFTIALSGLSYRYVERRFLKLKELFSRV